LLIIANEITNLGFEDPERLIQFFCQLLLFFLQPWFI